MNTSALTRRPPIAPLLTATALLLLPPALAGQEPPPLGTPLPREGECVCPRLGEAPRVLRSMARFNRARLGVELGEPADVGGRTGIRLRDVEDGGPAARAGIRGGDILLALNGSDLGDDPADRLLDILGDVEPGDTVAVTYSREGRQQTARVVTDRAHGFFEFTPGGDGATWTFPRMERQPGGIYAPSARLRLRAALPGLDLVAMNEGLGRYFDVTEGVLVAAADGDSSLGLRAGDVIVSIGGRSVQDPAHARSIIASYRPDETISFEIVRDRRRTTVTGTRQAR
ncbi:MAG TPA: PDZ domain-containing protein [Longimicrobiales bacterium]|nr:PDZ domain-containing protein [Longimicrobiales bacterium]